MKALSLVLKIIMLILAAIWGIGCGILFPAFILAKGEEIVASQIAYDPVIVVWLIVSVVGFVIPAALTMCGLCRIASVLSLLGFGGILYVYARFAQIYAGSPDSVGPTGLYMPCIFITILILAVTVIENRESIRAYLDRKSNEKEERAPSIFETPEKERK